MNEVKPKNYIHKHLLEVEKTVNIDEPGVKHALGVVLKEEALTGIKDPVFERKRFPRLVFAAIVVLLSLLVSYVSFLFLSPPHTDSAGQGEVFHFVAKPILDRHNRKVGETCTFGVILSIDGKSYAIQNAGKILIPSCTFKDDDQIIVHYNASDPTKGYYGAPNPSKDRTRIMLGLLLLLVAPSGFYFYKKFQTYSIAGKLIKEDKHKTESKAALLAGETLKTRILEDNRNPLLSRKFQVFFGIKEKDNEAYGRYLLQLKRGGLSKMDFTDETSLSELVGITEEDLIPEYNVPRPRPVTPEPVNTPAPRLPTITIPERNEVPQQSLPPVSPSVPLPPVDTPLPPRPAQPLPERVQPTPEALPTVLPTVLPKIQPEALPTTLPVSAPPVRQPLPASEPRRRPDPVLPERRRIDPVLPERRRPSVSLPNETRDSSEKEDGSGSLPSLPPSN